jgi:2-haloacid dehalogenase
MTTNIQAIVFDFGGVLLDWNPHNLFSRYFSGNTEAIDQFLAEIKFSEWNAQLDKGSPFAEGVATLSAQYPQHSHLIRAFHENWEESVVGEVPGTVGVLKKLKRKGFPLYGLSNWSAEKFAIVRRKYTFFDLLDAMVISGQVKLIKPDPAIFHLLLEKIGRPAHECLLIDDSEKNISVAKRLGFATIHFQSAAQLESELQQLYLL